MITAIIVVAYLLSACAAGFMVYVVADPYGHHADKEPWYTWSQVLLYGGLWPVMLVYIGAVAFYYSYIKKS